MNNVGRTVTALAVVLSILGPGGQHSALADQAVLSFSGSGTIQPGLSHTSTAHFVNFCGTGTVMAGNHADSYGVCFIGSGASGTVAAGGGCGSLSGGVSGYVCYSSIGTVTTFTGNVRFDGVDGWIQSGVCHWQPTSVNPMTTYNFDCLWVLDHA